MNKRFGFVGIIVHNRTQCAPQVNQALTEHGNIVTGRMGLPYEKKGCWVITVIVDATEEELNALTNRN